MKALLLSLSILLSCLSAYAIPYSVAHRGGHIDGYIPENCPAGVKMAKKYGYRAIECDVHYTKDKVMILMHDKTINRTMRNAADYSKIKKPVYYSELTYEELKTRYVLASSDPKLRKPIPTLQEELTACKKYHIIPMMHTDLMEAYQLAQKMLGNNWVAFNGDKSGFKKLREFSNCFILWDPGRTEAPEVVKYLKSLGGHCGISSMKNDLLTADYVKTIRDAGFEVQSSIFKTPLEVQSIADGVSYVLSDFSIFQPKKKPFQTTKEAVLKLEKDQKKEFTAKACTFGTIELELDVEGSVEVVVNNSRHYTFTSSQTIHRLGGWRYYKQQPTIQIIAKEASTVKNMTIKYYKM